MSTPMTTTVFSVARATGEPVQAPVLVTRCRSAPGTTSTHDRVISREDHPLQGESVAGRILLFSGVQGGVAAGWALLAMRHREVGFAGLVFTDTNPVMVQGAVTAAIPVAAGVDPAAFDALHTGDDIVRLDPAHRSISLVRRQIDG